MYWYNGIVSFRAPLCWWTALRECDLSWFRRLQLQLSGPIKQAIGTCRFLSLAANTTGKRQKRPIPVEPVKTANATGEGAPGWMLLINLNSIQRALEGCALQVLQCAPL